MSKKFMKYKKEIIIAATILVVVAILVIAGVWYQQKTSETNAGIVIEPYYPLVNSEGDPILGVFESRIPCGDCYAIKFGLILYQDPETKQPTTYMLSRVHVGSGDIRTVNEGKWSKEKGAAGYPEATIFKLDNNAPEEFRSYWTLNDNLLLILDPYGNPRIGHAGFGYILNKTY
jgi:hypothetical protein